ncbi:MAG: hypothetical protein ACTTGJ_01275 [Clostridium sp.]
MREKEKLYKALKEVSIVLEYTDPILRAKVPDNFTWFMENFKDETHYFQIDLNRRLEEQNLMYESIVILSIILKSSWCDKKTLKRLEEKYKVSRSRFFEDREYQETQLTEQINSLTIVKKENFLKKIFNKVKRFFGIDRRRLYMP